jgi:photosystem II stability/assembly factor-like uncharacterized protein
MKLAVRPPETETRRAAFPRRPLGLCLAIVLVAAGREVRAEDRSAGSVLALAVAPGSVAVFAGTAAGGLYRSDDGGESWTLVEGPLAGLSVSAVAIDGADRSILCAGTNGAGVFRSADGGRTWSESKTGLGNLFVEAIVFDPGPPRAVLAATDGGVFRSDDGCRSWKELSEGLPERTVTVLAAPGGGATYAGTKKSGIFRLDASGKWSSAAAGLGRGAVRSLAVCAAEPRTMYAGTDSGIFRSTNAGEAWVPVNSGLTSTSILTIAVDPAASNRALAGTVTGLFRTSNSGTNWAGTETGAGSFFNAIAFGPSGAVLLGGDGTIARSADAGKTWTSKKLPPAPPAAEDEE